LIGIMPGRVKVKLIAARDLPVMNTASQLTSVRACTPRMCLHKCTQVQALLGCAVGAWAAVCDCPTSHVAEDWAVLRTADSVYDGHAHKLTPSTQLLLGHGTRARAVLNAG
jgi:hypothetical protein